MNKLRHMAIFADIVDCGSITAAALKLELSKSVVSQHLKALEHELGVSLIKRSTRKHILTEAGSEFYQSCKAVNEITDFAWLKAQESIAMPQGSVKITAPNALMDVVIAPAIGQLLKQYPLLEPELIGGDEHVDLMANNIDLAIRVGPSPASNIRQRRIGEFRDVLCGQPQLLNDNPIDDISYIANTWQGKHIHHKLHDEAGNFVVYEATAQCRANSFYACLALIQGGAGVGLIPQFQFKSLQHSLVSVYPELQLPINTVYALYPYEKHVPLSVKVCIEAIEKQLNKLTTK